MVEGHGQKAKIKHLKVYFWIIVIRSKILDLKKSSTFKRT